MSARNTSSSPTPAISIIQADCSASCRLGIKAPFDGPVVPDVIITPMGSPG